MLNFLVKMNIKPHLNLVIAGLQTIFHTQFEGLLTTYLHTKFHIPTHNW